LTGNMRASGSARQEHLWPERRMIPSLR
jgi:hypothetical protein